MTISKNTISHRTGVSTFASRKSPNTGQRLQKSFHLSHADKIELKKISSPSENKKFATAQPDTTKTRTVKINKDNGLQGRTTEHQLPTAVWRNGGFSASDDSLVVCSSAVLRLNFSAKNPHLRQARNHWFQTGIVTKFKYFIQVFTGFALFPARNFDC